MNLLEWSVNVPWLAFIVVCAIYYLLKTIVVRGTRMVNVALRGWPPAHIDADGDWTPEPKSEE